MRVRNGGCIERFTVSDILAKISLYLMPGECWRMHVNSHELVGKEKQKDPSW